jgi:uncharacterized protein (TIGR04255 family)
MKLLHSPIIEAVLDVDCDMPPKFDLLALEKTLSASVKETYPKSRKVLLEQHRIERKGDQPSNISSSQAVQALQFLQNDELQIVQFRREGFSFNRLAPYSTMDDYLPEIRSLWEIFLKAAMPVQIRAIRVQNINRIMLPLGNIKLDAYFKNTPRPDDANLVMFSFLNQWGALEKATGLLANVVLTGQQPDGDKAPIILDITAEWRGRADVANAEFVLNQIKSLRGLKNRIFHNSLTPTCLSLFQQQ